MHLREIYYQQRAETNKSLLLYQQNFYLFFCYVNISNEVFLTGYFRSRYLSKKCKNSFLGGGKEWVSVNFNLLQNRKNLPHPQVGTRINTGIGQVIVTFVSHQRGTRNIHIIYCDMTFLPWTFTIIYHSFLLVSNVNVWPGRNSHIT